MPGSRNIALGTTAALVALALAGCDGGDGQEASAPPMVDQAPSNAAASGVEANAAGPQAAPDNPVLTADGFDTIRIGAPPAAAQGYDLTDDGSYQDVCRIYTSDRLRGVYAIVENGRVMRLTAFHREGTPAPALRTDRGITVGSTEADVRSAYSPLREEPHKYVEAPAKDLFFGGTAEAPGLRFEIGAEGRVTALHAGLMPTLGYVEGCS